MMRFPVNEFHLVRKPTSNCTICKEPIKGPGTLIHYRYLEGWMSGECHIECYCPVFPTPIVTKFTHLPAKAARKIQSWNRQFKLPKLKKAFLKPSQDVSFQVDPKQKRKWLEVLKFLDTNDLANVSLVSKEFYTYTWNIEIWRNQVLTSDSDDVSELRRLYIARKLHSCISCGDNNAKKLTNCPIIRKPICKYCRANPYSRNGNMKYYLWPVLYILQKHGINRSVLDRHSIPIIYDDDMIPRTYEFLVLEAMSKETEQAPEHIMITRSKRLREIYS